MSPKHAAEDWLIAHQITLRFGMHVFKPDPGTSVQRLTILRRENETGRLSDFPDDLNPLLHDEAKFELLWDLLASQSAEFGAVHFGRTWNIGVETTETQTISPVTVATWKQGATLSLHVESWDPMPRVVVTVAADPTIARERVVRATEQMIYWDHEWQKCESACNSAPTDEVLRDMLNRKQDAAIRRRAAAVTRLRNLQAIAEAVPAEELVAAEADVQRFAAPLHRGMPGTSAGR